MVWTFIFSHFLYGGSYVGKIKICFSIEKFPRETCTAPIEILILSEEQTGYICKNPNRENRHHYAKYFHSCIVGIRKSYHELKYADKQLKHGYEGHCERKMLHPFSRFI